MLRTKNLTEISSLKAVELQGSIRNIGLIKASPAETLEDIVYGAGGGMRDDGKLKAVLLGGAEGICIDSGLMHMAIDGESLRKLGFSGRLERLEVFDERTCIVQMAKTCLSSVSEGLCGKCIPCREGTDRMLEILDRITSGTGTLEDLDMLEDLVSVISATSLCRLGKMSVNPLESTLKYFRNEYIAHVIQKKCPAGSCKMDGGIYTRRENIA